MGGIAKASSFDPNIGCQVTATMSEGASLGCRIGMNRLDQVFDDESTSAETADKLLPPMQKLFRSFLAQHRAAYRRQFTCAIVGADDFIMASGVQLVAGLKTGRLFVLTDVETA